MIIINVILGTVLLLFGRRLFWLFVTAAGFVTGLFLARDYFQLASQWQVIAVSLLAGLIGALLAVFVQKLAVALAGLAAGGFLAVGLLTAFGAESFALVGFIIGGLFGAILLLVIFDWALIVLSALLGAALVAQAIPASESARMITFFVALAVGAIVQAAQFQRSRKPERPAKPDELRA
jgi:hypothetical protein